MKCQILLSGKNIIKYIVCWNCPESGKDYRNFKITSALSNFLFKNDTFIFLLERNTYESESIKNQPNLFLGEIDLFFFDVIAL